MPITDVVLARHGETDYNLKKRLQGRGIDAPLNERGRQQSLRLSKRLQPSTGTVLTTSSLRRARETAEPMTAQYGVEASAYKELDEMDFGIYEGAQMTDIKSELEELHQAWKNGQTSLRVEGGESPEEVFERSNHRIRSLLEQNLTDRHFFILHGRLLRILLSAWLGYGLHQMHRIEHSNGAYYRLQFDGEQFIPKELHVTDHLTGL
ncbi:MAG: histidine phosphatase family protein [Balneolaceae bacterium]